MTGYVRMKLTLLKKTPYRLTKRRGITDVISTMMLVMVTVAGSSTLIYFLNDGFVSGNLGTAESMKSDVISLKLLAYDTRDASSLLTITNLDNKLDQKLCAGSCSIAPNSIPANNGTEFLILQIKNNSVDTIFLEQIFVNNVEHVWDSKTAGIGLDASADDNSGKYPKNGKFSLFDINSASPTQYTSNQIQSGSTVNLLLKLDSKLDDIVLNKGIRLLLDVGDSSTKEMVLLSGDAR